MKEIDKCDIWKRKKSDSATLKRLISERMPVNTREIADRVASQSKTPNTYLRKSQ